MEKVEEGDDYDIEDADITDGADDEDSEPDDMEIIEDDNNEYEDVEIIDDEDDEFEDVEVIDDETGSESVVGDEHETTMGTLGAEAPPGEDEPDKARLLSEQFDGFLGSMEKYYNQYLLIPEGVYAAGSDTPGFGAGPKRQVRLMPIFLGRFPITNSLFEIFVEKTGYVTTAEESGYGLVYTGRYRKTLDPRTGRTSISFTHARTCEKINGACWYQPSGPGSTLHKKRNHPVVQVSHQDALAFAAWTGKRLPTEDEWESGARTKNSLIYPWGNEWRKGCSNTEENRLGETCPVGAFENSNTLNIFDTIGNVMEWTSSLHAPNTPEIFAVKSSSWISGRNEPLYSRTGCRKSETSNILGFRCVAI